MNEPKPSIFEVQPDWIRKPLPLKEVKAPEYLKRIMFFDPVEVYKRVDGIIDPFNRHNLTINFTNLFPKPDDGTCSCGCGEILPKGRPRWYSKDCQMFAIMVWSILRGVPDTVFVIYEAYNGNRLCTKCQKVQWKEADHIVPVSSGGAGCWLTGFQPLCKGCHTAKTREDFGWTKLKTSKNYDIEEDTSNPLRAGRDQNTQGI